MSGIGKRIREARELKAWTQRELADQIGLKTSQTVSNWERGDQTPNAQNTQELSRALEKPVAWLLGLSEEVELVAVVRELHAALGSVREDVEDLRGELRRLAEDQRDPPGPPRVANGDQ